MGDLLFNKYFLKSLSNPVVFAEKNQRCTGQQRHHDFIDGGIEAERRELKDARLWRHAEPFDLRLHEAGDSGMSNRHPFGHARRPGGVDHIGEVLGRKRGSGIAFRKALKCQRSIQDQSRVCVGTHVGAPCFRITWIQRQPCSACLYDSQQHHDHFDRALPLDADDRSRADAASVQMMGKLICSPV